MKYRNLVRYAVLSLASGGFLLNYAVAQDAEEDVFELSPFSVQAEDGWVATETLAGSRLRTNFKDVASQVEVMTMEFMDDFAVNSVEESLIYSINVSSPEDHVSGNGEGFGNEGVSNFNQIRGVLGGTLSRNFFPINMPTDNYNVSRVTIASGPNSILFGTGSPAGVLDVTLNRAQLGSDFGKIKFEVDSWNGKRYVFDYNKTLIEDKLALRVAWVDDNAKQDIEPNHDKSTRTYGTLLYKPFENTTLSLHAEKSKRDLNRTNRFLPYDSASPWFNSGKPVFSNVGGAYDSSQLGEIFNRQADQPTIVLDGSGSYDDAQIFFNSARVKGPEDLPGVWNLNIEADGWTFIDDSIFPDDVDTWGTAEKRFIDDTQYNVFLEQKLAENLYIELGYNQEDYNMHTWDTGMNRNINVDVNEFNPDGSPNPHFGEFYLQGNAQWQNDNNNRENWRATVSYEYDFADRTDGWVGKLGRHRLASLLSNDKFQNKGQQGMRYRWLPDVNGDDVDFPGFSRMASPNSNNNWATDGSRQLTVRHYLTEGSGYFAREADDLTLDGRAIQLRDGGGNMVTLPALEIPYFDENGRRLVANNAAQGISNAQDTLQFAYQGYFWNNRVVVTYGWRQDEASSKTFDVTETVRNSGRDSEGNWRGVYDASGNQLPFARPTGLWPYYDDLDLKVQGVTQKGITRTKGVVFHATENFSLHFNESDTFQPNIGRFDPYGTEYPGAEGEGQDMGFTLTLLDNKLAIRYNEFETLGGPQRAANTPFNRWRDPIWNVENRWRNLLADPTYPGQGAGGFREKGRCCYWVMSDKYSEGKEVTITANPIPNLNLRFTWTERDAIESNIGAIWDQYMNERLAVWTQLNVPEGGENDPRDLDGDGEIGTWTWETAWYNDEDPAEGGDTLADRHFEQTIGGSIGWALIQSLDGKANEFDRTGRWNFNASYRIREGKLKGLTYGGALRWREAPVIGYGITGSPDDPESVVDLTKPKFGAEDFTTDLFASYRGEANLFGERSYKVQLNVRNALDEDDNVPGIKDINGNNIRMIRKAGRQFVLSFEVDI